MQARTPYRPCMPQPDDHPDSIARRLIEALAATRGSPKAVLDECRELRAWDPEQLDTLMQAFDAAHAERRLPDSVHAIVREALKRWRRDARNGTTDQMAALTDHGDWTEEMQPPETGEDTGELQRDEMSAAARGTPAAPEPPPGAAGPAAPAAAATTSHPAPALVAEPGVVLLGRYELESLAGSGGTALVHRARDRRRDVTDGELQHVAIKTPRADLADPERAVARLRREFRQTRALPHPNIVAMFDLDCDRGLWFITLEWLDGESLAARLGRVAPAPLPASEVWPILRTCAQALAFAHGRGIVHGDIKPSNVMITPDGEAHLLDFGAAPDASPSGEAAEGEDQRTLATRCYASPEALAGEAPDARDDVFSLACMAYEMLAGTHPFHRQSADAACAAGAAAAPIPGLGAAQLAALVRGLAWRREDRPAGALQWLDDLQQAADEARSVAAAGATATTASAMSSATLPGPTAETTVAITAGSAAAASSTTPPATAPQPSVPTDTPARRSASVYIIIGALCVLGAAVLLKSRSGPPDAQPGPTSTANSVPSAPPRARDPSGAPLPAQTLAGSPAAATAATPEPTAASRPSETRAPASGSRVADVTARATSGSTAAPDTKKREGQPARQVTVDAASMSVGEGAFAAVIMLRRLGDRRGSVPVRWQIESGTAEHGRDFAGPLQGKARFASGQTVRTLYVPLVDDGEREGPESFTVSVRPTTATAVPGDVTRVVVTIDDDD